MGEVKGEVPIQIDPYDDFVKRWIAFIEYKYDVRIDSKTVRSLLREWTSSSTAEPRPLIDTTRPYYIFFDITVNRSVIKTPPPAGGELENIMLQPLRTMIISQNVLMLHLLELWAIEQRFDREIDEMIGAPELEEGLRAEIEEEFSPKKKKQKEPGSVSRFFRRLGSARRKAKPLSRYFIRPGPYESNFKERVTKVYMVGSGRIYQQMVDFWKDNIGVK
jgi:hypothetical protein